MFFKVNINIKLFQEQKHESIIIQDGLLIVIVIYIKLFVEKYSMELLKNMKLLFNEFVIFVNVRIWNDEFKSI